MGTDTEEVGRAYAQVKAASARVDQAWEHRNEHPIGSGEFPSAVDELNKASRRLADALNVEARGSRGAGQDLG